MRAGSPSSDAPMSEMIDYMPARDLQHVPALRKFFDDVLVALGVARRVPLESGRWGVEFDGLG